MAQGSRQIQTQAQQQIQTLSPQQILVVKLLELPAIELEDRVRAELLENPALEEEKMIHPAMNIPIPRCRLQCRRWWRYRLRFSERLSQRG